ncbi:A24 family peptidase [Candidatus Woesearchaeota archaeon]|nr:A24 family peptidase [Candidatus Woesearchaeota archaeon]
MIQIILATAIITGLVLGTFFDIKTREVPDWINYSLIFLGFGLRLFYSINAFDFTFILEGVLGFALFFLIGMLMFYTGQWGGGDTKLLMGVGALIGFSINFSEVPLIISFFANLLLVGAAYGLLFSLTLAIRHWKKFILSFRKNHKDKIIRIIRRFILITSALILIPIFIVQSVLLKISFIALAIIPITTLYIWLFAKSVEQSCMFKKVKPVELTEGDWIEDDIKIGRKRVYSKKELGVSKETIKELIKYHQKGKIRNITVKEGIPFVPSFLLAYIITLLFSSWFMIFI